MDLRKLISCLAILEMLVQFAVAKEDLKITEIKKWYSQVEGNKKLKATTFSSGDDELPHSVKVTRYESADGKLQKLYVEAGGEHGVVRTTYYYKNQQLFFVYEATNEWRFTGEKTPNGQDEVIDIASEYRFYFNKGKCIKALNKRVELVGGDELNELLKEQKNEELEVVAAMSEYLKKSIDLAKIKSKKSLLKYYFDEHE